MRDMDYVIHAAAYKRVPSSEANVSETIKTNVNGSLNVALAAVEAGVKKVVGISTDKACDPTNTYGTSKKLMEALFVGANAWSNTIFTCARYGNVVGSNGSVIPFFDKQGKQGKDISITHRDMTRFFITLDEAVDLIQFATFNIKPGTILIPKAKSFNILDLARLYAEKYNVGTTEIGIRPGEKIHESMLGLVEGYHAKQSHKYIVLLPPKTITSYIPPYTSDHCERITKQEMIDMIKDYEKKWKN